jgi:hypothetical protein
MMRLSPSKCAICSSTIYLGYGGPPLNVAAPLFVMTVSLRFTSARNVQQHDILGVPELMKNE